VTARQFALEIDSELDDCLDELRTVVRKIALEALSRITNRTPVDTGRARGNWFVQIGDAGVEVSTTVDKNGGVTISRGAAVVATYKNERGFPQIVIYNNLPYIGRLEDGYSNQAPTGMVEVTVTELQVSL
jgi:hypothetical protein